jgi:anthranilate synthase component 1
MYFPSFKEFSALARRGNLVPVYREILADLETPVSAYLKIVGRSRHSYLLESIEGGEKWARYSFLGSDPSRILSAGTEGILLESDGRTRKMADSGDPLSCLKEILSAYHPVSLPALPRFCGGAVGFLSYDMVRHFEKLPDRGRPGLPLPDLCFMVTDTLLIFDRVTQTIKVVSHARTDRGPLKRCYEEAVRKIDRIIRRLSGARLLRSVPGRPRAKKIAFSANMTRQDFERSVLRAKEYIRAGDIFQAVLSQRFSTKVRCDPFESYRALRLINPSPYMYHLRAADLALAGASPELLVRCEEGRVEVRPIAGTRPRGRTEEEEERLVEELLSDPKERAEHIMLVDLGRNDVGRVAAAGSVRADHLMSVEKYSHVTHLVSHVSGELAPRLDAFDALRACFPAGTVTGAPKIRAMEIIEELEPVRRGPYAGAVGYVSFSGNMDMCINIRSITFHGGRAYIQAGAGIVADSDPEREYDETVRKARAMLSAIERAEGGLG